MRNDLKKKLKIFSTRQFSILLLYNICCVFIIIFITKKFNNKSREVNLKERSSYCHIHLESFLVEFPMRYLV